MCVCVTKKLENYNVAEVGPIIKLMCVCVCIYIYICVCVCVCVCDKETGEL